MIYDLYKYMEINYIYIDVYGEVQHETSKQWV